MIIESITVVKGVHVENDEDARLLEIIFGKLGSGTVADISKVIEAAKEPKVIGDVQVIQHIEKVAEKAPEVAKTEPLEVVETAEEPAAEEPAINEPVGEKKTETTPQEAQAERIRAYKQKEEAKVAEAIKRAANATGKAHVNIYDQLTEPGDCNKVKLDEDHLDEVFPNIRPDIQGMFDSIDDKDFSRFINELANHESRMYIFNVLAIHGGRTIRDIEADEFPHMAKMLYNNAIEKGYAEKVDLTVISQYNKYIK